MHCFDGNLFRCKSAKNYKIWLRFDTELVSNIIFNLKHGKAAGTDGLSTGHLKFCHPVLSVILAKLFQLMLLCSYVPSGFRYSYIVHAHP